MDNIIIQLSTAFISVFGFSIVFKLRSSRLIAACVGGLMTRALFIFLTLFIESEPINYFIVASAITMYAEVMARLLKTPATPIATISLIPLIPGGSLYYTMASAFGSDLTEFIGRAVSTLRLAASLALGLIIVSAISQSIFRHSGVPKTRKRCN